MIVIRELTIPEAGRISEIDRSEHVTRGYAYRNGILKKEKVDWHVPAWTVDGQDDFNLQNRIKQLEQMLLEGHAAIGAFRGEKMVGIAILRYQLTDRMAQLTELYVSREYRRRGIATQLTNEIVRLAGKAGASELYVSAVPSGSAVGFYLSQGFQPTDNPVPELFDLEPEDIHMIRSLG